MSDLTTFRDHCRAMASPNGWARLHRPPQARSPRCFDKAHASCTWGWQSCRCTCHDADRPKPPTPAERTLWTRLADEIDRYLTHSRTTAPDDHTQPLWETS